MGAIKSLNIISSTYLIISGVASLFFLGVVLIQNDIEGIFWVTMPLCIAAVVVTIVNNYKILRSLSIISKKNLLINIVLTAFQAINVSFNGFQFKYNQGLEIVVYANMENISKKVNCGAYVSNFNYFLNVKFIGSEYSVIGLNLLALSLFLFYFYQYKRIRPVAGRE
ncbi:hypothetical protein HDC90_003437 [Pedobacter sp. AK013]|uniref:hypothetical protein n=1 Tax=Pedobacter sp. AK013 TaxID=2723071 RepID=UPI001619DEB8|nr:hypothetical protein [Pedobacter sp. AK013]MBB6238790.1 hypothetical protein [Pedobacter sp. AK013]